MKRYVKLVALPFVLLGVLALLWMLISRDTPTFSTPQPSVAKQVAEAPEAATATNTDLLVIGNPNARTTIVEYADFKCPNCGKFHREAGKQIRDTYVKNGQVNIEFRPFPLFGEDAGLALYGSYCANEQKLFTAYHDAMFDYMWDTYYKDGDYSAEARTVLTPDVITKVAVGAGNNEASFRTCLGGKTHGTAYNTAVDKAAGDSVQGTPSVIIGSEKVVGPQPFSIYKLLIDTEVKRF